MAALTALNAQQQAAVNQSQAMQQDFQNKSNSYASDYSNYQNQANQAQGDIKNLNSYMAGAGSASNLYNTALTSQEGQTGYNQQQMQDAMRNLSQAQGSLSAYNDFANTAASKYGMNAGGLAAANASAQGSINNNIAAASQGFQNQQQAFSLAQQGAAQVSGLGVQQQQTQLAGYKNVYDNAFAQQQQAQQNMQAYAKLAQDQGGLTAQQYQAYTQSNELEYQARAQMASASAAMASAQASLAQARNVNAQTDANNWQLQQNQQKVANDAATQQQAAQKQAQQQAQQQAAQQQAQSNWNNSFLGRFTAPMANSLGAAARFFVG